jgi:hypothetical protein
MILWAMSLQGRRSTLARRFVGLGIGGRSGKSKKPTIDMKRQADSSTQEVLAGLVERVTYHNAENGFCVVRAKARGHCDLVTVVGHAATIAAGEWITASGEWVNDRTHGQQFKARFLRTSTPTSAPRLRAKDRSAGGRFRQA